MKSRVDLSCFSDNYHAARERLLHSISQIPNGLIQQFSSFKHPLPGPDGDDLFMDWLQLGQSATPARVLVLISATHGVEGFAGSAIQCNRLPDLVRQLLVDADLGVILIHALNPWGFAWLRRYDHEGIDLNRNFIDFNEPLPDNSGYAALHEDLFVHISEPLHNVFVNWRTRLGEQAFDATITRGQYKHADGLFYGGSSASWSRQILQEACEAPILRQAERIAVIDLHTGLGPFGHGEVINDHSPDTDGFKLACDWYGANAQSALLGESCSAPKTGLLDYYWHRLMADRGCFVTLEFGTYPLPGLLGFSCEEQRYHIQQLGQGQARSVQHPAVTGLRDFFYPLDSSWRELVLFRAGQIICLAIKGMRG